MKTTFAIVLLSVFTFSGIQNAEARKKSKSYKVAKKECLADNPDMKGQNLRKCIREKRKHNS